MKTPQFSIVAAYARDRVMGDQQKLPWHLPADLAHFKALTLHKTVVMGRKTYDSIGRPLPNRRMIVLSRDVSDLPFAEVVPSLEALLSKVSGETEVMIIGGAQIYALFLPLSSRLYLTEIDATFKGDTYFPEYSLKDFQETHRELHAPDEKNPYSYKFITQVRI